MKTDHRDEQNTPPGGRPRADIAGTGASPQTREEEAHDTRAGRPMPEEDSVNRTVNHKSGYGGEHGEPRERPEEPDEGAKKVK